MNTITITFKDGPMVRTRGEVVQDHQRRALIVYGEDGFAHFNWDHILYFSVSESEGEDPSV